jgi:hypothetical protein
MSFVVKPGRNATLRDAWEKLYGPPKKAAAAKAAPKKRPAKKAAKKGRRK